MKRMLLVLLPIALLAGCATNQGLPPSPPPRPAAINHVVFFKLVDPTQADALIAACDARLATIPGVVSYYCGPPIDTGRDTVDADYDVGFYVGFASEADYAAYVSHPSHLELVTEWRPRFQWLRVHDILDPTP